MKVALFIHLFSLVVAYGAVIFVDIYGLLWALNKKTKSEIIAVSKVAQPLIWLGLTGLIVSGFFLHPNFSKAYTQIKMIFVLIIILNGINLHFVSKATKSTDIKKFIQLPKSLIVWSVISITLSQLAWFSAMLLGFLVTIARHF